MSRGRWIAGTVLVLYLLFLAACATATFLDPVWGPRSGYSGILGLFASFAAGLPWSFVLFFAVGSAGASDAVAAGVMWGGALVNLALLGIPLGFWDSVRRMSSGLQQELQEAGELMRDHGRPGRQALIETARQAARKDLREAIVEIATRFDTRRKVPQVRLLCVLAAVMVLLWVARAYLGVDGAPEEPPDRANSGVELTLLLLLAVAGTCCRHFCSNASLQHSRPLYLLATAGTAAGTILGFAQATLLAAFMPVFALIVVLFAGWQAWLLAATVGTRFVRPPE